MEKPTISQLDPGWAFHNGVALQRQLVEKLKKEASIAFNQECALHRQRQELAGAGATGELGESVPFEADTEWKEPLANCTAPTLQIFNRDAVDDMQRNLDARVADRDERKKTDTLVAQLRKKGGIRRLTPIPDDWPVVLGRLDKMFPNFCQVIEYLRCMCLLASHGDRVARFSPILLNGPAGLGKTLFAECLARELGWGFVCIRMENAQTNSAISGSSEFWSNSRPGEIFNWLVEKDDANPLIALDEIDKIGGDARYDPMSSLYSLFEPMTAKSFVDLSNPWLTLDASHIGWICTSNDADLLPEPILSRVKRFDITQPTRRAARRLALQLFYQTRSELPTVFHEIRLSRDSLDKLAKLSPRRIRKTLPELMIATFARGAKRVAAKYIESETGHKRASIGFIGK